MSSHKHKKPLPFGDPLIVLIVAIILSTFGVIGLGIGAALAG